MLDNSKTVAIRGPPYCVEYVGRVHLLLLLLTASFCCYQKNSIRRLQIQHGKLARSPEELNFL
jgi:hypothetical protein